MNNKPLLLKILFGYFILLSVIGIMVGILLHEHRRMKDIGKRAEKLQKMQHNLYTAHQNVAELAFMGESIINWEMTNCQEYQEKRLETDRLLCILKVECGHFIRPIEVDSLRYLLEDKEALLLGITKTLQKQDEIDSLLIHQLPVIAKHATRTHTITRKKKGIAGFFGKKETITVPSSTEPLHELNDRFVETQKRHTLRIETHIDSLTLKNEKMNTQLVSLIKRLNTRVEQAVLYRTQEITMMQKTSFKWVSCVISFSLLLLIISFLIIQKDLRLKVIRHRKLQNLLDENNDLLAKREKIILTLSHDIRNPLHIIGNYTRWAMETREKKKRNRYLEDILHSYQHILKLVNNLLDVYRLNSAKEMKNEIPFFLRTLLTRITQRFSWVANDKGLRFSERLYGVDIQVKGDPDRLEQIIDNLLANAIKFTDNGCISFSANYSDDRLVIDVEDTGIGIDKENIKRIFAPFEQTDQQKDRDGFGLGLSIVQGLVQLLEGKIEVSSQLGKGSLFHLILPLPATIESTDNNIPESQDFKDLPKSVILIDDDPIQLELCKEMLERNGIHCTICANKQDLVGCMRNCDYDLLLTDIQMPGTNGFDLLKLLRESDIGNSKSIPIVAMTARGEYDVENLLNSGFTGFILKPFSSNELLSTLSKCYKLRQKDIRFDLSLITSEVKDRNKILEMLVTETSQNVEDLKAALITMSQKDMHEIVHRMISLWEILQREYLLDNFRNVLNNPDSYDEEIKKQANKVIIYCMELIEVAKSELKKI